MTIARKGHRCTLCGDLIPQGAEYIYRRLTPWDHPLNDCFFSVKSHLRCWDYWNVIGPDWDWEFGDESEFKLRMQEDMEGSSIMVMQQPLKLSDVGSNPTSSAT